MIAYYEVTNKLREILIADENINKVVTGLADIDTYQKQNIYPLANIIVGNATIIRGAIEFSISIIVMDAVDVSKGNIREEEDPFKGLDNKQDVLNDMLSVCENLEKTIRKVTYDDGYTIGQMTCEPFEDRFTDVVTGWMLTVDITVPNTVQRCN